MKLKESILISILLLAPVLSRACSFFGWQAADYMLPRIWGTTLSGNPEDDRRLLLDWQRLAGAPGISLEDISEVVFNYSAGMLDGIGPKTYIKNGFEKYLADNDRKDIIGYLKTAKECEEARGRYNSRWYYPCAEDGLSSTLEEIRDRCLSEAAAGGQLSSRYVLQALRAMTTLQEYPRMDSLWRSAGPSIPDGVIREMCLDYMARVDFETGSKETAVRYYAERDDISSLQFCLKRMNGKAPGCWDILEQMVRFDPDNIELRRMMQEWFTNNVMHSYTGDSYSERMSMQIISIANADRICRICDTALGVKSCRNPAVWLYVKALALDLSGRSREAVAVNDKAALSAGDDFIWDSIRVLSIYLDAKNSAYDSAYEARLLRDLRWLDAKITGNITDDVRNAIKDGAWELRVNKSFYYWNDMLKKIILGEVCPRMIDRGKGTLAIRLANMADNRLLNHVDCLKTRYHSSITMTQYRNSKLFNCFDYSNGLFQIIDAEVPVQVLEKYVRSLGGSLTGLERFLDDRGYTNKDYFLDVIGTRYIREMKYEEAVRVLEKLPSSYQYRLNTSEYMDRDPFQTAFNESGLQYPDYKLGFARRMAEDRRRMTGNFGPDERGRAMIDYGLGLKSSFSYAWALTAYFNGFLDDYEHDDLIKTGERYIRNGLAMIRDREVKAQELLRLQARLEIVQHYRSTSAGYYVLTHCDEYKDYR